MTEFAVATPTDEDVPPSIHAAGAVLWRPAAAGPRSPSCTGRTTRTGACPRARSTRASRGARTAVREIAEETGFGATLGRHLATVRYPVGDDRKVVDYWEARAGEGTFTPNGETDELRWLAPPSGRGAADPTTPTATCSTRSPAAPAPSPRCCWCRHAKAGKRGTWPDDDARPLVDAGRDQARRVADLLTAHGVPGCVAAPKVRCRETLEPASHRLGVGIADDPAFTDEAVARDPATRPRAPARARRRDRPPRSARRAAASRPWCATSPPTAPAGSGPRCSATAGWPTRRRARAASGPCPSTRPRDGGRGSSRPTTCGIPRSEPAGAGNGAVTRRSRARRQGTGPSRLACSTAVRRGPAPVRPLAGAAGRTRVPDRGEWACARRHVVTARSRSSSWPRPSSSGSTCPRPSTTSRTGATSG